MNLRIANLTLHRRLRNEGITLRRGCASGARDSYSAIKGDLPQWSRFAFTTTMGEYNWRRYGGMQVYAGVVEDGYDNDAAVRQTVLDVAKEIGFGVYLDDDTAMIFKTPALAKEYVDARAAEERQRWLQTKGGQLGYFATRWLTHWHKTEDRSWAMFERTVDRMVADDLVDGVYTEPEGWIVRAAAYKEYSHLLD